MVKRKLGKNSSCLLIGVGKRLYIGMIVIHAGVVVGTDGFGFAPGEELFIHQVGARVSDNVELGSATTVDQLQWVKLIRWL